jgi:hypothetical protein
MLETVRDYPTAITAGPEHGDRGMKDAIRWVLIKTKELGGQPLVYAPGKSNIEDVPLLAQFAKTPGVAVRTWRQRHAPWRGGVVLAAWPTREKLGEIADGRQVRGLVVVPWAEGEVDAWVAAADPERLGPVSVPPVDDTRRGRNLDPVVAEGLKTLTRMVNHANNLAGSLDRRDAVAVLRTLNEANYPLPPDEV